MVESKEDFLQRIFTDPQHPASFQGPTKLHKAAQEEYPSPISLKFIKKWLAENQESYSLNRPVQRTFKRNKVVAQRQYDQYDADLADMRKLKTKNDGIQYLLVVIDVFSRFLWVEPLADKSNKHIIAGFKRLFARAPQPRRLRTDKGNEFTGVASQKYFDTINVEHFVTYNEEMKANFAERAIQTLKSKLWRYMKHQRKFRYIDVLPDMVKSYNHTLHSTIKMKPAAVTPGEVSRLLFWSQYKPKIPYPGSGTPRDVFKVGDHVRIAHSAKAFERAYNEKWSLEIFQIERKSLREGVYVYWLKDLEGECLLGTFYAPELQHARYDPDKTWEIEKVIQRRQGQLLVKWRGWPNKFNSWVPANEVELT